MARKYLDELDYESTDQWGAEDDDRIPQWDSEREEYGFDNRDTWSLDHTMTELLYERLKMFSEVAPRVIVMTNHTIEYEGVEYNQEEAIEEMIRCARIVLEGVVDEEDEAAKRLWDIWAMIRPAMWW